MKNEETSTPVEVSQKLEQTEIKEDDKKFYGKYRGVVVNPADPKKLGRIQVRVVDTVGVGITGWAEVSTAFGGPISGIYVVPMIGACVWVEFEKGEPDHPIVTGYRWNNTAAVPQTVKTTAPGVTTVVAETPMQNAVIISDGPALVGIVPIPGGVALRSGKTVLAVTAEGVSIEAPMVTINKMSQPSIVNINNNALIIT